MITWFQRKIIKHSRFIFGLLLIVIIMAFVLTIGPTSGFKQSKRKIIKRDYFGLDLNSEKEMREHLLKSQISSWISIGFRITQVNYLQPLVMQRVVSLSLADEMNIPDPTEAQLLEFLGTKRLFKGEGEEFSSSAFTDFKDQISADSLLTEELTAEVINEDYRIDQMQQILGGPGYVLDYDARKQIIEDKTQYTVQVVKMNYTSFTPEIKPSDDELKKYYEENKFKYEVPVNIKLTELQFTNKNYFDEVTPEEAEIEAYFEKNKFKYQKKDSSIKDEKRENFVEAEPKEITLPDVVDQVILDIKKEGAKQIAGEKSDDFTYSLFKNKISKGSDEYKKMIDDYKIIIKTIDPYAKNAPPLGIGIPEKVLKSVFDLNEERYFSDIAISDNRASILIFEGLIDKRIKDFEEAYEAIKSDYSINKRRELFVENGKQVKEDLVKSLAEEKTLDYLIDKNDTLTIESYGPFEGRIPPTELHGSVFEKCKVINIGEVSSMMFLGEEGKWVYLMSKDLPNEKELAELNDKITKLQKEYNQKSFNALISEISNNRISQWEGGN